MVKKRYTKQIKTGAANKGKAGNKHLPIEQLQSKMGTNSSLNWLLSLQIDISVRPSGEYHLVQINNSLQLNDWWMFSLGMCLLRRM